MLFLPSILMLLDYWKCQVVRDLEKNTCICEDSGAGEAG